MRTSTRLPISLPLLAALILLAAEDDWLPFGQSASVHKIGATVTLDYKITPGQLGLAILQTPEGKLAGMTHLQFRVKTDVATMVGVMLSETKPGGDYAAIFWSPKDQWQQIDLTPADFNLNDGPKDPHDPDGRLDVDQVQAIGIFDGGQFLSQAPANPKLPIAVNKLSGDHKLQWEDFRIVTEAAKSQVKGVVIDDFRRGFLTWFTPGGAELALSKSGNPLGKPALEFRYQQDPNRITIVMHTLGQVDLRGSKQLSFDVASLRDAHVIISLEAQKVDGRPAPRYNHDFTVSAGQTGHMSIPFSEFTLAEDSPPDPAGHLELGKIRSIGLVDISGMIDGNKDNNTLWLAEIKAQ
jgi:hypothetical protein